MSKSLIMIFISVTLAVGGQLFLKSGMEQIGYITGGDIRQGFSTALKVAGNFRVVFGLFLYTLSAVVWLVVLSRVDLSYAYPILGSSYVIVLFASRLLFNEEITPMRLGGAALISLGVILISRT